MDCSNKHLILFLMAFHTHDPKVYLCIVKSCKKLYNDLIPFLYKKKNDLTKLVVIPGTSWTYKYFMLPNGNKHGEFIIYCGSFIKFALNYKDNHLHGSHKKYYTGKEVVKQYCYYLEGDKHGKDVHYNEDGTVKSIRHFQKGLLIYKEENGVKHKLSVKEQSMYYLHKKYVTKIQFEL